MPWTWARAMPSGCSSSAGRAAGFASAASADAASSFSGRYSDCQSAAGMPAGSACRRNGTCVCGRCGAGEDAGRARRCRCWCSPGARMTAARRDPMRIPDAGATGGGRTGGGRTGGGHAGGGRARGRRMPRGPRGIRVRGDGCVPCGVRGACASVLRRQSAGFRVMGLRRDGGRAAGLRQRLADRVRDEAVHAPLSRKRHAWRDGR